MTSTRRGRVGSGSGGRMWTGEGVKSTWTSTQKITDIILSFSHAKKSDLFSITKLRLRTEKSEKFSSIYIRNINY